MKEKNKEIYSPEEKRAYYMGYGAGRCGLEVTSDKVQKMLFGCKDDKVLLSMTRGVLDGRYPLKKGKKRSSKK